MYASLPPQLFHASRAEKKEFHNNKPYLFDGSFRLCKPVGVYCCPTQDMWHSHCMKIGIGGGYRYLYEITNYEGLNIFNADETISHIDMSFYNSLKKFDGMFISQSLIEHSKKEYQKYSFEDIIKDANSRPACAYFLSFDVETIVIWNAQELRAKEINL